MRTLIELTRWFFWTIDSGLWTLYHTLHSRHIGPLIIDDNTENFICRRCGKIYTFEVPWETRK